jgi:hypothetical protein
MGCGLFCMKDPAKIIKRRKGTKTHCVHRSLGEGLKAQRLYRSECVNDITYYYSYVMICAINVVTFVL